MPRESAALNEREADRLLDQWSERYRQIYGDASVWFLALSDESRAPLLRRIEETIQIVADKLDINSSDFASVVANDILASDFIEQVRWVSRKESKNIAPPTIHSIKWVISYKIGHIVKYSSDIYRVSIRKRDYIEKLKLADDFVRDNPGKPISEFLRDLFPSPVEPSLPKEAPEKYQGLRGPETPPAFVQRVYGEWLGHGLTRAHIRRLDPTLATAIENWSRKPENEWPTEVDLPTLKEHNTRWADRVGKEGIMSAVEGLSGQEAVREARRITALRHRRSKEQRET